MEFLKGYHEKEMEVIQLQVMLGEKTTNRSLHLGNAVNKTFVSKFLVSFLGISTPNFMKDYTILPYPLKPYLLSLYMHTYSSLHILKPFLKPTFCTKREIQILQRKKINPNLKQYQM